MPFKATGSFMRRVLYKKSVAFVLQKQLLLASDEDFTVTPKVSRSSALLQSRCHPVHSKLFHLGQQSMKRSPMMSRNEKLFSNEKKSNMPGRAVWQFQKCVDKTGTALQWRAFFSYPEHCIVFLNLTDEFRRHLIDNSDKLVGLPTV